MTSFIIDWQQGTGHVTIETEENHFKLNPLPFCSKDRFKLNPLPFCTKDRFNFEMEARMILQTDDDSIIIKNFGSFPIFIENTLGVLIGYFFIYKERQDIMTNRLKIKEELVEMLQKELTKYNVIIIEFMIVSMLAPQHIVRNYKKDLAKESIKETNQLDTGSDNKYIKTTENLIKRFSFINFMLIVVSLIIILTNIERNDIFRLSTIISIIVLIICAKQYFEIRKLVTLLKGQKAEFN